MGDLDFGDFLKRKAFQKKMLRTAVAAGFTLSSCVLACVRRVPLAPHSAGAAGRAVSWERRALAPGCEGLEEPPLQTSQWVGARAVADGVTFSHLITTFSVTLCTCKDLKVSLQPLLLTSLYTGC